MVDFEIRTSITGVAKYKVDIEAALAQFGPEMLGVLIEEGEEIIAASKEIVPVDDVVLQPTGGLYGTEESKDRVAVLLGYGGLASSYAKDQHETPPHIYKHSEGRAWKYLETPVFAAAATMGARFGSKLAARIGRRFSGGGGGGAGDGATFGGN